MGSPKTILLIYLIYTHDILYNIYIYIIYVCVNMTLRVFACFVYVELGWDVVK